MGGYGMQNVRLASMKPNRTPAEDVRYRRNSGKHLLAMSSSQFDPERTWPPPEIALCERGVFATLIN
jgi:hypothetical protein